LVLGIGLSALMGLLWSSRLWPQHYTLESPLASVLIVGLLSKTGSASSAGRFLGGISYPFYLNHWVGLFFIKKVMEATGMSHLAAALVALAISLGFSAAHYWAIDQVIHKRRNGWFNERRGMACAVTGFALVAIGVSVNLLWLRGK
jgi:peptidoglycan/LPS O-acetylase OafA/YrhL